MKVIDILESREQKIKDDFGFLAICIVPKALFRL